MQCTVACHRRPQLQSITPRFRVARTHSQAVCCNAEKKRIATISEARKLLASRGWTRAWIDGITERLQKRHIKATIEEIQDTIDVLEEIGFKGAQVEHVCTMAWHIFQRSPEQVRLEAPAPIRAVAEYVRRQGARSPAKVLFNNPKLLEYDVAAGGEELAKGDKARARIRIEDVDGREKMLVSIYRPSTEFMTAPIAPWSP